MDIWLRRAKSFAEEGELDAEFWTAMSPDERVATLERMRQEWIEEHGSDEGLRRTDDQDRRRLFRRGVGVTRAVLPHEIVLLR